MMHCITKDETAEKLTILAEVNVLFINLNNMEGKK